MKLINLSFLLLTISCKAFASDFHIEDSALKPVPSAVSRLLFQLTEVKDLECKGFIGLPVALDGQIAKTDWIAITSDGCAWGASNASIWVVQKIKNQYRVVLSSGGQAVTLGVNKQIGLRHIAISSGTAGHYSETLFKFNGAQYQKVKNRFVDLSSSSNGCKKPENKDVC